MGCYGCALGSLALAITEDSEGLHSLSHNQGRTPGRRFRYLVGEVYGDGQSKLIEDAYERQDDYDMFHSYRDASYRLRSILSNIILNKGTFDPTTRVEPIA